MRALVQVSEHEHEHSRSDFIGAWPARHTMSTERMDHFRAIIACVHDVLDSELPPHLSSAKAPSVHVSATRRAGALRRMSTAKLRLSTSPTSLFHLPISNLLRLTFSFIVFARIHPGPDPGTERELAYEQTVIDAHDENTHAFSTGRGGAGNIRSPSNSRSRSRDPGPGPVSTAGDARSQSRGRGVHSFGRGGAGNILPSSSPGPVSGAERSIAEEDLDEIERLKYTAAQAYAAQHNGIKGQPHLMHSTGRGGLANVTDLPAPPPDAVVHDGFLMKNADGVNIYSTGRGGVGNIRSRSGSRSRSRAGV